MIIARYTITCKKWINKIKQNIAIASWKLSEMEENFQQLPVKSENIMKGNSVEMSRLKNYYLKCTQGNVLDVNRKSRRVLKIPTNLFSFPT